MTSLSVVVIGRNEGQRLKRCLESVGLVDSTGIQVEVIYVDSNSSDGSLAVAQQLGAQTIALQAPRPSAALGRNAGWRSAAGEFILFLDADTVLDRTFVRAALPHFSQPATAILWGHRRELYPTHSIYNRVLDLDWIYHPGQTLFCGGDALFRRSVLEQTGGFDDTLIAGEEPELCRRIAALGYTIQHADLPMTGHDLAITTFSQYWRRSTRAGHAYAEVSARFAGTSEPFWRAEAIGNQRRACALLALAFLSMLPSLVLGQLWPLGVALAIIVALALRSAYKARWKTNDWLALALYGLHSHLQQIPIVVGQLQFWNNHRTGRRSALVEYK